MHLVVRRGQKDFAMRWIHSLGYVEVAEHGGVGEKLR